MAEEQENNSFYGKRSRKERGVKQIIFEIPEEVYVNLSLRLDYDNLGQKEFFTNIIDLYNLKDEDLIKCIRKIQEKKLKNKIRGRVKENYEKLSEQEKKLKKDFGLDKTEISDIFDILEKDFSKI